MRLKYDSKLQAAAAASYFDVLDTHATLGSLLKARSKRGKREKKKSTVNVSRDKYARIGFTTVLLKRFVVRFPYMLDCR